MKTIVTLPVSPHATVLVSVGASVSVGTLLTDSKKVPETAPIPLAQLLKIKPATIAKYLKKRVDEPVLAGDVIAYKKSFFSSAIVRSPHDGSIQEIDLLQGTIRIGTVAAIVDQPATTVSPVSGIVTEVEHTHISIEVKGTSYEAVSGKGEQGWGKLISIKEDTVDMFAIRNDVADGVILCQDIAEESVVKMDVLGAMGIISLQKMTTDVLPWMEVEKDVYTKLSHHADQMVLLQPRDKKIIVMGA